MADALKPNNSTFHSSTNTNTNNLDFFEKDCQTTFNDNLSNLFRKVNSFKPTYLNISNPEDKEIALVSFILSCSDSKFTLFKFIKRLLFIINKS